MIKAYIQQFYELPKSTLLLFVIFLVISISLVPVQDYREYLNHWNLVLDGDNPWKYLGYNKTNTYPPVHAFLGYLTLIHPYLPRLISTLCVILIYLVIRNYSKESNYPLINVLFLFNPFIWISGSVIGHNDVLVATLCLFCFLLFKSGRKTSSSVLLAIATCLKIYPIIFFPFFSISEGKIQFKWATIYLVSLLTILAISFLIWDSSYFYSFTYNITREPKFLSIFRTLSNSFIEFDTSFGIAPLTLIISSQLIVFIAHIKKIIPLEISLLLSLLGLLTFHIVGHAQFYYFLIVLSILILGRGRHSNKVYLKQTGIIFITFFSVIVTIDHVLTLSGISNFLIREWVGLPMLLISGIFGYVTYMTYYQVFNKKLRVN